MSNFSVLPLKALFTFYWLTFCFTCVIVYAGESTFQLASSKRIEFASPQAEQLSMHNCNENQQCCTSSRDLFKDALLKEK